MQEKQSNSTDPDRTGDRGLMKACDTSATSLDIQNYGEIRNDGVNGSHVNGGNCSQKVFKSSNRVCRMPRLFLAAPELCLHGGKDSNGNPPSTKWILAYIDASSWYKVDSRSNPDDKADAILVGGWRKNPKLFTRFASTADIRDSESCWRWLGTLQRGYGKCYNGKFNENAHRVSYKLFVGEIPESYDVDHLCRNPSCVNPFHLEAVTKEENHKRAVAARKPKTCCHLGHEFTEENTLFRSNGNRECRKCKHIRHVRYQQKIKSLSADFRLFSRLAKKAGAK